MRRCGLRVPIGETVEAMAERVQQGKARHLGLSEVTAEELREASDVHRIAAVLSGGHLEPRCGTQRLPAAAELGVGLVPYSPLGRVRARRTGSTKTAPTLQLTAAQLDQLDAAAGAVAGSRSADPVRVSEAPDSRSVDCWHGLAHSLTS